MTSSRVSGYTVEKRVTPTITAGAYASADQMGGAMELSFPLGDKSQWSALTLISMTVVDLGKQNVDIEVMFWNSSPTLVADNAVADFDDTEMKTLFCGSKSTGSTWNSYNDNSSVTVPLVGLQLKPTSSVGGSTAATKDQLTMYASAVVRGAPTYTSTGDLTFIFNFAVDAEY